MRPLPTLSSCPLSLATHVYTGPLVGSQRKGKMVQGRGVGMVLLGLAVRKGPVQPALYLEATHPVGTGQLPPGSESHICSSLFISHTAGMAVCFIHSLQCRKECCPYPVALAGPSVQARESSEQDFPISTNTLLSLHQ